MANFNVQQVVVTEPSKYNVPRVIVIDPVTGEPADLGGAAAVPASTTVAGIVELATNAETTTGTDIDRAVTPAGVKAVADTKAALSHTHTATDLPAATSTGSGIVELATNAETTTGTDTVRAVTPAGVKAVADTKAALSHTHTATDLPTATSTGSGVVELATNAETTTGTDTARAVTPAGVKAVADTKVGTDGTILNVAKLTQAAYTALGGSVVATTLYVIVG